MTFVTVQAVMRHMRANPGRDRGRANVATPSTVREPTGKSLNAEHRGTLVWHLPLRRFRDLEEVGARECWMRNRDWIFLTGIVFDLSVGSTCYRISPGTSLR
jgi:hypothetical protein